MPLYIEKINGHVDRQGEYRAICLFRKLENRKKAEICNLRNIHITSKRNALSFYRQFEDQGLEIVEREGFQLRIHLSLQLYNFYITKGNRDKVKRKVESIRRVLRIPGSGF